jgi:hypothetical protein
MTNTVRMDLYTPIQDHQLGKLVHDEGLGLVLPFKKSYGHIYVDKWEDDALVKMDTLMEIPSLYKSEDVQPIIQKLPPWTEISFNGILSSLFWYARRRYAPFLPKDNDEGGRKACFDYQSPSYQCPFCHGFDNYLTSTYSLVEDFGDIIKALQHIVRAHTRIPLTRKIRFLYDETQECPNIRDAWKVVLREDYDAFISSLERGDLPQVVVDLCEHESQADSAPQAISQCSQIDKVKESTAVDSMPEV